MKLELLELYRIRYGGFASSSGDKFGAFSITSLHDGKILHVICAPMDGEWQHVSVSKQRCCPTWEEMSQIKDMFWNDDETVVQFHPKKSEYVNNHAFCLHLWKKKGVEHELPPSQLVGIK